jgi:dihydrofolate reductase
MRRIVVAATVSLDGVMQGPGAPEEDPTGGFRHGGWIVNYWDGATDRWIGELIAAPFDLLLGRKTYEIFAAHWQYIKCDPIADAFNRATKYVATRSEEPLTWKRSVAMRNATDEVARLKRQDGPALLVQGSSQLLQTLLLHDLIDEFRLLVFPLVLGRGKRLFAEGSIPVALTLVDSKVSTTGVTMTTYRRAGEITTGSFALEQPTAAEIARRERLQREEAAT